MQRRVAAIAHVIDFARTIPIRNRFRSLLAFRDGRDFAEVGHAFGIEAFTPIINAPEVAILGVSRSAQRPVYRDGAFVPRLMLPLSLSYDHRVIDGAPAALFLDQIRSQLEDRAWLAQRLG